MTTQAATDAAAACVCLQCADASDALVEAPVPRPHPEETCTRCRCTVAHVTGARELSCHAWCVGGAVGAPRALIARLPRLGHTARKMNLAVRRSACTARLGRRPTALMPRERGPCHGIRRRTCARNPLYIRHRERMVRSARPRGLALSPRAGVPCASSPSPSHGAPRSTPCLARSASTYAQKLHSAPKPERCSGVCCRLVTRDSDVCR